MSDLSEVALGMNNCSPHHMTANRIMLCTRNIFLLENMRDIHANEYHVIIRGSGSAGIIKE